MLVAREHRAMYQPKGSLERVHAIFLHGGGRQRAENEVEWGKPREVVASNHQVGGRQERWVKASSSWKEKKAKRTKQREK